MTRRENSGQTIFRQLISVSVKSFVSLQSSQLIAKMYFGSLTSLSLKVCKKLQMNVRLCSSITLIYLVCTVLCFALKVGVSVLWQDGDQDTNCQSQGQDVNPQDQGQGTKNLPRGNLKARHCLEASHQCQLAVQIQSICTLLPHGIPL